MHWIASAGDWAPFMLAAAIAAALVALVLTPVVRAVVLRLGMVDEPDQRRVNQAPVPRAGGIATTTAFVLVALAALAIGSATRLVPMPTVFDSDELIALFAGGVAAAMIGLIDDYLQVRARWQLLGQVAIAVWAVALGIEVDSIANPFGPGVVRLDGWASAVFTIFWIVGMINSINFIDGLDGLSSGIGLIAAATLGFISMTVAIGQPMVALFCFILAGALLGFLRWNFHPATVFAGTSGVMFLGFSLALLSIVGSAKVAVALLVLGVPIIDTFWIIVRRLATGRTPFSPDRGHIHHRLLDLGLSHTQAVLAIYAMCVGLALLTFILSGTGQLYAFLGLFVATGVALFVLARRDLVAEELRASSYEAEAVESNEAEAAGRDEAEAAGPNEAGAAGRGEPRAVGDRPGEPAADRPGDPAAEASPGGPPAEPFPATAGRDGQDGP